MKIHYMIVPVVYFYSTPGFSPSASKLSSSYRLFFIGTSALWKLAPGYKLGFKKKTVEHQRLIGGKS